ncbi:hypothetical protein LTR62_008197 [Meristemomyces frigidus]|uniref:Beta-galactosidase n=1 Tax=Meristemomyces frigidus TaxID=1508187 RepID=A0AAN7TL35_9PEZI|nr:hypothetical protein LTR62_008197 [Meristemomyces frigidus]
MKLFTSLALSLHALTTLAQQWPLHDDGYNGVVQWDHYSLQVNGERLFFWSGEFHYWRIPVPELWRDVMEKIKAGENLPPSSCGLHTHIDHVAGFNAFSIYVHWGFHSSAPGQLDFETGAHNFSRIFDIAQELGLYMLVRPGPYINGETTAGGFPGWLLDGSHGATLRDNGTKYTEAWEPYWRAISKMVADHAVTKGGPVLAQQIENEYGEQWTNVDKRTPNETAIAYMELLEKSARDAGVDIPFLNNNPNLGSKSWSLDYDINRAGGDTDLYGLDNYPSCWSCDVTECTSVNGFPPDFTTFDYYTNFQQTAPTQPSILAEFQGGSYNPWSGPQGGCLNTTGVDWVSVFYRNNIGNKIAGQNIYMLFGGTNWGGLPIPVVGTSYDYSAPISESRMLTDKYSETKLLSYFVRTAKDLTMVERAGNGTTNFTSNPNIFVQALRNVETNARFYVAKHANTTLTSYETFKLNVITSVGQLQVPQYANEITINGRAAKILVTEFPFGDHTLIYSTVEVLIVSLQSTAIIAFWLPPGECGEFYLKGAKEGSISRCDGCADVAFHAAGEGLIVSFTQNVGMSVMQFDNGVTALLLDRSTAYTFWQPSLSASPTVPLDETILVRGPYLVRTAEVTNDTVYITGDYSTDGVTELEVFASMGASRSGWHGGDHGSNSWQHKSTIYFNNHPISMQSTHYGSLLGSLTPPNITTASLQVSIPPLTNWRVADGLPERMPGYNDSGLAWKPANQTTTLNAWKPATLPVLYADDYGFHTQNILWRGRFTGKATAVFLNIIGGTSSGWSAWLNGVFLGSTLGNTTLSATNATLAFPPNATVNSGDENILFILQDHMGHDETTGVLNPRGVLNATLITSEGTSAAAFTSWRVAGNAGGEHPLDPVRAPYNEGGLHAERLGWHLPGFDTNSWSLGSPETGLSEAGAKFYTTVLPLDIPTAVDVSLAFELSAPEGSKLRAQLYVNGYMFGKFIPHVGNQVEFPVFPGVLDYQGDNTIGLSVWAQGAEGARMSVGMKVLGVHGSGLEPGVGTGYLRPGWSEEREWYA